MGNTKWKPYENAVAKRSGLKTSNALTQAAAIAEGCTNTEDRQGSRDRTGGGRRRDATARGALEDRPDLQLGLNIDEAAGTGNVGTEVNGSAS
jgi:hypothetical protein